MTEPTEPTPETAEVEQPEPEQPAPEEPQPDTAPPPIIPPEDVIATDNGLAGNVPPDIDDVRLHADEAGDVMAEFKERVEAVVSRVEEAATKVRAKLAETESDTLHELYEAFAHLRDAASDLVPSQTPLKTPSPSLDPEHPQGLGRKIQEGEMLQQGVV